MYLLFKRRTIISMAHAFDVPKFVLLNTMQIYFYCIILRLLCLNSK